MWLNKVSRCKKKKNTVDKITAYSANCFKGLTCTPREDRVQFAVAMMHGLNTCLLFYLLTWLGQNANGSEIINGAKVGKKSMLFMASVQNDKGHVCGGFLISEDFVLTAAHCDDKSDLSRVVLGTHDLKRVDNNTIRRIEKKCKHPSYKNVKFGNDIMLLKLSKKAQLNKKVKLIGLPKTGKEIKDNQKCSVAGWGSTKTGGNSVDDLQVVEVPIINLNACKKQWEEVQFNLPANIICAGGYQTENGFCQGDSGGPLVCNKMAVGVVSFNRRSCDYPNVPNVYTDISKYLPWITSILKKKKC
ncbi:duodenase-1-like isoform X2 [Anabas testudineus]|uniref:duodenase-1-like isoform X2 n=1 Tax=Anabas testudineus TaxID=64144 RepID=UPI000E46049C|nr:duodenase-1-like isoform X2 [Anabas testudineus]